MRDPGGGGDLLDGGRIEALADEQVQRDGLQPRRVGGGPRGQRRGVLVTNTSVTGPMLATNVHWRQIRSM